MTVTRYVAQQRVRGGEEEAEAGLGGQEGTGA